MKSEIPDYCNKRETTQDNIITIYHSIQIFYFMKILIINWVFIKRELYLYMKISYIFIKIGGFNIYLMIEYGYNNNNYNR